MAAKRLLKEGTGLYKPNERALVTVTVKCWEEEAKVTDKPFTSKENHQIVLGEPENILWYKLERTIMNMREGEEIEVLLSVNEKDIVCRIELLSFERGVDQWDLYPEQKLMLARNYKSKGNDHFKKGEYTMAAMFYSKSLKYIISTGKDSKEDCLELKLACMGNMSACQLKLKQYQDTIRNCNKILQKQPHNSKALYRRGVAYFALRDLERSEIDLLEAKKLEPESKAIAGQLRELLVLKEEADKRYQETVKRMFSGDKT